MSFLNGYTCWLISRKAARGEILFLRSRDYYFFLRLLKNTKTKYQIKIFGFCLLPNEFYLVLGLDLSAVLGIFVRELWQVYATYRYDQQSSPAGHQILPQKDIKIRRDQDLFDAIKYVEFVPARLGLVDSPLRYPWSSCSYRVLGDASGLIDTSALATKV